MNAMVHPGSRLNTFRWVQHSRAIGGVYFGVLKDWKGEVQVVIERHDDAEVFSVAEKCPAQSVVQIDGKVVAVKAALFALMHINYAHTADTFYCAQNR